MGNPLSVVMMNGMQNNKTYKCAALGVAILSLVSGCNGYFGETVTDQSTSERANATYHTVEYGDTLNLITRQYDTPFATLVAANNIAPPYPIHVGQVLRIPLGDAARRIWPSPRRPLGTSYLERPQPNIAQAQSPRYGTGMRYVVGPGDNLARIAIRHDLSIAELVSANRIEPPYEIYPGQDLVIPPSEAAQLLKARHLNALRTQQAIEAAPSPPLSSEGFLWPVDGAVIRTFQQNSRVGESGAINIAAHIGTPVRATNNGIVAFVGKAFDRYGQMIVVRHADDYVSLYAHNDDVHVEEGDAVQRGQVIADVGKSGDVSGSGDVKEGQLRFELRKGLQPIDPLHVLDGSQRQI